MNKRFNVWALFGMVALMLTLWSCSGDKVQDVVQDSKVGFSSGSDSALFSRALRLYQQDSVPESLDYAQQAYRSARMNQNQKIEIMSNNLIGYIYLYWHDYESSLIFFLQSLEKARNQPDMKQLVTSLHGLGRTYILMKETEKALEPLNEALEITLARGMKRESGKMHIELGNAYTERKDYELSLSHLEKALEIAQETSDSTSMIYTLNNIGQIYNLKGEYGKSLEYLEMVLRYNQHLQNQQAQAAALGNIGEVYLHLGSWNKAADYINQSITISLKQGFKIFTRDNYLLMSKVYEKKGDPAQALHYYKRYAELEDSLYNEDKNRAIENLVNQYTQREKDKRIANLEQQARNRSLLLWLTISVTGLSFVVLALLIISLRLRIKLHKKDKSEMGETISHKNRELVSMVMQTNQKRKMLEELEKTLEKLTTSNMKDIKGFADDLKGKIKSTYILDSDWDVLKTHFEEVHPDFFRTLQKLHPELSQNDLKLCAYIRINLSTKEIARLLNISDRSVQTAKYRIKKKVGLPSSEDLVQYISGI